LSGPAGTNRLLWFITHPEVVIDPTVPVPDWPLSPRGVARMTQASAAPCLSAVTAIYASAECKARQAAEILGSARGLPVRIVPSLHENDRSATGFLPPPKFEATADRFFAEPDRSVRGWERAVDAQARIVRTVSGIAARNPAAGDVAVVAHGAVGALLLCHLLGTAIDRRFDQPGRGGGNVLRIRLPSLELAEGWADIDMLPSMPAA
jgi:broad specificity phosphatase PhoE